MSQELEAMLLKIKKLLPSIHGWCSFEKATALVKTIVQNRASLCVEIGTFGGSSLVPQALALQHNGSGKIYGIDPWSTDAALEEMQKAENVEWWSKVNLEQIYKHCQRHVAMLQLQPYVQLLRDKAENVVDTFADGSIDLLHIDGNHSEALSYKDAVLYLPKVAKGGIVFFDDIHWNDSDEGYTTQRAIMHMLEHCTRLELVDDCMIMQKNKRPKLAVVLRHN